MATKRLPMQNIREILRLKWTLCRSHRDTARSLGISAGAVASVVTRVMKEVLSSCSSVRIHGVTDHTTLSQVRMV